MADELTRRNAIKVIGAAAAGAISLTGPATSQSMPDGAGARESAASAPEAPRKVRIAHMTDFHVQPERHASEGVISALRHAQARADKPQLILAGGDMIMDSFEANNARTKLQWDLWRSIVKHECSLPVEPCIGNHDIWGWSKSRSRTRGDEPNYGKKRALEALGLAERYRAFSIPNSTWRVIVLDSTQSDGADGYRAYLDPEQLVWLTRELNEVDRKTHVLIMSHIPIVSASAIMWSKQNEHGDFAISGSLIHQDAIKLKNLFAQYPCVKLCLSGHLHLVDRVDYNGVTYMCNGAVCGNWWKGRHKDCDEGYAIIDLYDDGRFERFYLNYGWLAAE